MTDSFNHPKRRLARARHHIEAFNAKLDEFMSSNPQQLLQEINADGSRRKLILGLGPIPGECEDHAVDAIAGLRATLDYAAFASATILGANDPRSAYFPFGDTAAGLENTIKGRCKDLQAEVRRLLSFA